MYETIRYETSGDGIATVSIDRPDVLNALNSTTRRELESALGRATEDGSIQAVVLTGTGDRAFSAGQDINESKDFSDDEAVDEWIHEFSDLYERLISSEIPIVARLNGDAIGSALQVALLSDIRVAAEDARFGMNEINIGIPCILGGWIIHTLVGHRAAAELTLTGNPVSADRAAELGLVNRVVPQPELDSTVDELARDLADKPSAAMTAQKRWLRELRFEEDFEDVIERSAEIHADVYATGEPEQHMSEFL